MKIYIIPVAKEFQPKTSKLTYPKHSSYIGVEREFYNWMVKQNDMLTSDIEEADYCYLPIFWTNYFLNHDFAKTGMDELCKECKEVLLYPEKTFTLCQYDDGPLVDLGGCHLFLASRRIQEAKDIPLLCSPHIFSRNKKKYLASFVGRAMTHPIRKELKVAVRHNKRFLFLDGKWGEKIFVKVMEKSYACLCPRGYGGGSFRFYEAMQMGVVPVHIGDIDIRPFKGQIDWDKFSFYFEDPYEAIRVLEQYSVERLDEMGKQAAECYSNIFSNDNWCKYVIKELKSE